MLQSIIIYNINTKAQITAYRKYALKAQENQRFSEFNIKNRIDL
ncbi:hypothetical protein BD94_0550 [Elizabethkingia anophelis NUHP1]|uniref:Uncharacterized protein n=1 Tax=Elizabethkingia anophelis NUHP1 TaxID=1338011 RepID=A0A077EFM6_9FLAO|nr:hypothetical protein BD94_0550 [Elizabethkingia anophelis NUHP1]